MRHAPAATSRVRGLSAVRLVTRFVMTTACALLASGTWVGVARASQVGDGSYTATWSQGPGTDQTQLVVSDTSPTVSIYQFYLDMPMDLPSDLQVTAVDAGCTTFTQLYHPQEVFCRNGVPAGQSVAVTITTSAPIETGETAHLTVQNGSAPFVPITLDAAPPGPPAAPSAPPPSSPSSTCPPGQTGVPPQCHSAPAPARCVVPNVSHMTLAHAERLLRTATCRTGKIYRPWHARRDHTLRVVRQSAPPRSVHVAGFAVSLTLK